MSTPSAPRTFLLAITSLLILTSLGTGFWLAATEARPQTKRLPDKRADSQAEDDQDRLVETVSFPNEPVRITEVKSKKGVLKMGVKFKDADDWFKGLRIKIQNTSGKPVNYVSALVTFTRPEAQKEAGRIPFGEPLTYGTSPLEIIKSGAANPSPSIPPGESIELNLAETDFDEYKALLKRLDFPDAIKRIEITLQEVGFEDGLLWSGGEYWRRDPNDRNKFILAPKETGALFFLRETIPTAPNRKSGSYFQKIGWVQPVPLQTPGCNWVSPELTIFCNDELTCSVRARRSIPEEPSTTQKPETINQRCRNKDDTFCDPVVQIEVATVKPCPTPTPSPTPRRPPPPDEEGGCDWCFPPQICRPTGCASPVLVDTLGDGLALTDAETGVDFDITARGQRLRISWTRAGSDDAWLALDRDGNGRVDNGAELFGNFSPQPAPQPGGELNGFAALAEFDKGANGGNADGVIDAGDAVFARLRLWRDANHDGVSQPGELYALPALDVVRLHLDYKESKRADEYGNEFRFRAKLDDAKRAKARRWAWDVFLVTTP